MSPFGLMMLVHPAALCLVIGTALAVTGVTWIFLIRKYPGKHPKIKCTLVFLLMLLLYVCIVYFKYDIAIIHFEVISGL